MINKIKSCKDLQPYITDECLENGICVSFDNGISSNDYVIIKVDNFYNNLNIERRPASADCLIVRKCINGSYGLTIVELKDIHTSSSFKSDNIREKFDTCLNDFIKNRFRNYLDIDYSEVRLYFVSNIEVHKRDLGLKLDFLINLRFKFNQRNYMIEPKMPTPTIKRCY